MLIACAQAKRIGAQCRENAEVLVPGATLQTLLRGSLLLHRYNYDANSRC